MTILAPYIFSWGLDCDESYKIYNLKQVYNLGLKNIIIAFLTLDNKENLEIIKSWKTEIDAQSLKKLNIILSLGGANSKFPCLHQSDASQANKILSLLKYLNIHSLDFDIEGTVLNNHNAIIKWVNIIKNLTNLDPNFKLDFQITLPVEFSNGLNSNAIFAINAFKNSNIKLNFINCMTMDFFTPLDLPNWSDKHIEILKIVNLQLCKLFKKSSMWEFIGVCPMIGINDDKTFFTLNDWTKILCFCNVKKIGLVSFWAINRDQSGNDSIDSHSNCQQVDLQYTNLALSILK